MYDVLSPVGHSPSLLQARSVQVAPDMPRSMGLKSVLSRTIDVSKVRSD